jgi:hypothetical protein
MADDEDRIAAGKGTRGGGGQRLLAPVVLDGEDERR